MFKRIVAAGVIGLIAAFALLGVGAYVEELGLHSLAKIFIWPNQLLQLLAPPHNIGPTGEPVLEGSPLNDLAFIASVPLAAVIYGVVAFFALRLARRYP